MTDDVRDEAQRLVAAALAAASFALRNAGQAASLAGMAQRFLGNAGSPAGDHAGSRATSGEPAWSTGTPECCVCPVCRAIAALRDPSPEFAARVASGASDVAAGLTSILREFSAPAPPRQKAPREPRSGPTWRAATHHDEDWPAPPEPTGTDDPWHAATTAPAPRTDEDQAE
jgi:hypothetical protein